MLGLFATLNLGTRALQAQQAGVEVAGHNLANLNTPGYSRQRLLIQTSPTFDTPFGPQGTGADAKGIQQIRDALLDQMVREEESVGGYWGAQQDALRTAQTALNQSLDLAATGVDNLDAANASSGLAARITALFTAFDAVAANPAAIENRQMLASQGQALADAFQQTDGRLARVAGLLQTSAGTQAGQANDCLAQIAWLNQEIAATEFPGAAANELRDQRCQKLEELAGLVSFESTSAPDGTVSVSVGGVSLVQGGRREDTLEVFETGGGTLGLRAVAAGSILAPAGGALAGTIAARDGALRDLRVGLDTLASGIISQVNDLHRAGYSLNGSTGADFFTGSGAVGMAVNATLISDPAAIQAAGAANAPGDNTVARQLAELARQPQPALGGQDFGGAYRQQVVSFGYNLWNVNQQVANHGTVSALLTSQRDAVSGVSMEEEMTSLMTYQKAYQASARIVTTVNEMLETLLSLKR